MKSHILNGRWIGAFLLVATALCIMPAVRVQADTADETNPNGPVFLILSLEEDFDTPTDLSNKKEKGSPTIIVEIGKFLRGVDVTDTKFKKYDSVKVKLPKKIKSFAALKGYEFTILGSFDTDSENTIHLASPYDGEIPMGVEEAFFIASPYLTDEFVNTFPTTVDIAQFIYDTAVAEDPNILERHEDLSAQQILDYLFRTDEGTNLVVPDDEVYAEGDGDIFPHDPGERLFRYEFAIDTDDGDVDVDMSIDVVIDIKPGNTANNIESTDQGVVWAAVLSTSLEDGDERDFYAPDEIDLDYYQYVKLGGSNAKAYKVEDVDHDGVDDVNFKFDVADIGLDSNTTSVTMTGPTTTAGTSFRGTDTVTIKK
jgi:hypothetical protein